MHACVLCYAVLCPCCGVPFAVREGERWLDYSIQKKILDSRSFRSGKLESAGPGAFRTTRPNDPRATRGGLRYTALPDTRWSTPCSAHLGPRVRGTKNTPEASRNRHVHASRQP